MTTARPFEPQPPQPALLPADLPTPPPAAWMPLDEVAQAWATFGASTRHPWGWQATSSAFAALSHEAAACQQAGAGSGEATPARGLAAASSDPHEAVCADLEEVLACWQSALLWLEHLPPVVACGEDLAASGEDASLALDALLTLSRWHRVRLRALLARLSLEAMPPRPASLRVQPRHSREVPL